MDFNNREENDWPAYRMFVVEELKELKQSLEKLKVKVEDIRGIVIEQKTKMLTITVGIPTFISIVIAAAQVYFG